MMQERPNWWHVGGYKLRPVNDNPAFSDLHHRIPPVYGLEFRSDSASLNFHRYVEQFKNWSVWYEVRHVSYPGGPHTKGLTVLSDSDFAEAFGLTDKFQPLEGQDAELVARFSATIARRGKFIRTGRFLNIPGPGTGYDGDPSLSIYLGDIITDPIRRLADRFPKGFEATVLSYPTLPGSPLMSV